MGVRTILYAVTETAVCAAELEGRFDFDVSQAYELGKFGPLLDFLASFPDGARRLYYEDAEEVGDADFRFFMPDHVKHLVAAMSRDKIAVSLGRADWDGGVVDKIYPIFKGDRVADIEPHLVREVDALGQFFGQVSQDGKGIISVTA